MTRLRLTVFAVAATLLVVCSASIAEFEWKVYKLDRAYAAYTAELDRSEALIRSSLATAAHTKAKLAEIIDITEKAQQQ